VADKSEEHSDIKHRRAYKKWLYWTILNRERIDSETGGSFLAATPEQACDLVSRIIAGDGFAESELAEHYSRPIKLILLKRTGSVQLANDLCQDTFVVILKKLRAGDLRKP
jgi:RNA polymerase sigma-70 factor (ECF subfamily)